MKANTAVCLVLLAVALLLLRADNAGLPRLWLGRALAGVAGTIALLTGLEHATAKDFGIDQLLFKEEPGAAATVSPGRMGPPACVSIVLASVGLGALSRRHSNWTQACGVAIAAIVSVPILGYAYGSVPLFGVSHFTGIALHTALSLLALAIGLMFVRADTGFMAAFCGVDAGGVMARRLLLPGLLLPFTVVWLRTLAERIGWIDPALGSPLVVVFLTIALVALITANARVINRVEWQRLEAEREKAAGLEQARHAADQARAAAETASRAKSDFIAALSHELRTPLSPVLLAISALERHPRLPPELREELQLARHNLRLETRLISDLLDVTRIENRKLELDLTDVDLHHVLRDTARLCGSDDGAAIALELHATASGVNGDDMRIRQIFWNLLSNAQKFTPRHGRITVTTENPAAGRVRVTVRDTGAGIRAETIARLFRPFEQGPAARPRGGTGLGLGLSIARRLVEAHQGTISVTSDGEGQGAVFMVEFPVLARPGRSAAAVLPARAATQKPLSILLVEDHAATQFILRRLLGSIGHSVTAVGTVAEATQLGRAGSYDVLLSDIGLPDGSGHDLMQRLGDRYRGRSVALSGYGTEADIAASRDAGFAVHLVKPVDLAAVLGALDSLTLDPGVRIAEPRAADETKAAPA